MVFTDELIRTGREKADNESSADTVINEIMKFFNTESENNINKMNQFFISGNSFTKRTLLYLSLCEKYNISVVQGAYRLKDHYYGWPDEIRNNPDTTVADKIYYAQVLVDRSKREEALPEEALPILEDIVEFLRDSLLSTVIWPEQLRCFLDDCIGDIISKSTNGYTVFPSVVYARYLLAIVYESLGDSVKFEVNKMKQGELIRMRQTLK